MKVQDKDLADLIRYAKGQGWTVERTANHIRFSLGAASVVAPSTASDYRSFRNTVADLRRAGLAVPRKAPKGKRIEATMPIIVARDTGTDLDTAIPPIIVTKYPHISAILGQWRSWSWFQDGFPITEEQFTGYSDSLMAQGVLAAWRMENQDATSPPTERDFRIMLDVFKFWSPEPNTFEFPGRCICGKDFSRLSNSMHGLGRHLIYHHERAEYDHAPNAESLQPWVDPEMLASIFEDDQTAMIEDQENLIRKLRQQVADFDNRYMALKRDIQDLLED